MGGRNAHFKVSASTGIYFVFGFQVIRQDDLSNRDFCSSFFHPMGEADRLCRTAGFSVRQRSLGREALHHIAVSVGVDAWGDIFPV